MQLKIYKILNSLLGLMLVLIAGLCALYYFWLRVAFPDLRGVFFGAIVVVCILLFGFFKWMENTWDKRVITRMAKEGYIALANLRGGEHVMNLRDSSFVTYRLFSFDAEIITPEGQKFEKTIYEKMNRDFTAVPKGSVYVTYDESKPSQIFIIPNQLISSLPQLMHPVAAIEKMPGIDIKYLDAYYHKGMMLRTMRQSVKEQSQKMKEMKKK